MNDNNPRRARNDRLEPILLFSLLFLLRIVYIKRLTVGFSERPDEKIEEVHATIPTNE